MFELTKILVETKAGSLCVMIVASLLAVGFVIQQLAALINSWRRR